MRRLILALCLIVLGAGLGRAAEEAIKVFYNGQPSKIETVEVKGGRVVPVYFTVPDGEATFEVHLRYDAQAHKLTIDNKPMRPKTRGEENCYYCAGSGQCQNCYPLGSGVTASGKTCYLCNGSSKCSYCGGSGKK